MSEELYTTPEFEAKLEELTAIEGYDDVLELLEANQLDSVVPGICINAGCDHTGDCEPDGGCWCDNCGETSIKSCMLLANII